MEDISGNDYGMWHVICFAGNVKSHPYYACMCRCGTIRTISGYTLVTGKSKSCGCICAMNMRKYSTVRTHGMSLHPLYLNVYSSLKQRCYDPNQPSYKDYGARGIRLCDEWLNDFSKFYEWMVSNGWYAGCNLSIDRIDVNGDYCPENCRLATPQEQMNNRRDTVYLTLNNERKPRSVWAE